MSELKIGDRIWWFESDCGCHWTERFFVDELYLESGIFEGINHLGFARIENQRDEYSGPSEYYHSKREALEALSMRLKELLDDV